MSWVEGLIDPADSFLPWAVKGFFDNGGRRMFVARVTRDDATTATLEHTSADQAQTVLISVLAKGAWGDRIFIRIAPGIRVFDPRTLGTHLVLPIGHVAGIYARVDIERGVHKASANEVVRGMVTADINATRKPLEFTFGKAQQGILTQRNVNVICDFRASRR